MRSTLKWAWRVWRVVLVVSLLGGFYLMTWGVLRQNFTTVADSETGFSSVDFDDSFESNLSAFQRTLVRTGASLGFVREDMALTAEEKASNAASAVAGVGLMAFVTLRNAVRILCGK